MSIVLSWNKKDADDVLNGYEIYRSTVKASLYQEANRIATIGDKAQVQYTDNNTMYDTPYWYGVRSKTVYGDVDSTPLLLVEVTNPGYGSPLPLVGDYEDGFVETYPNEISFTSEASKILNTELSKYYSTSVISNSVSPQAGGIAPNGGYAVNKFWRNGRPIFVPNHPIGGLFANPMVLTTVYNQIVAALTNAKPRVEIEGVLYEFRIMTREEALKYIASGSAILAQWSNNPNNVYADRVTPITYNTLTSTSNPATRLFHQNGGDGVIGFNITGGGTLTDFALGTSNSAGITIGFAWYFTPAIN